MKRSMQSGVSGEVESREKSIGAANGDSSEKVTSSTDARATSSDNPAGEGSMRYRIAAMIAMLLLALSGMAIWFYLRFN